MATILDLLMALNRGDLPGVPNPAKTLPVPLAPVPNLGPLSDETSAAFGALNPEPVPPRFIPPAAPDENFVSQYQGAAPTPPAPLSRAQRIFNAIGGFGAGFQGQGAQFLDQLREPQREYQRQVERREGRRTQGIELAERRAEGEADRANRANEMLYESEYKKWLAKNNDRSAEAKQRMAQALVLERDARRARLEADRETQRERRQQEQEATRLEGQYFGLTKNRPLSRELAEHYSGKSTAPLSAAATKLDARIQGIGEAQMGRAMRVGGGGGGGESRISKQTAKLVEEFNNVRENLITATARNDAQGQKQHRTRLNQLVRRLSGRPGVEAGYGAGQWPYVKVNGQLQGQQPTAQPQAQGKTITRAEMQTLGVTEAQVKAEGFTITP